MINLAGLALLEGCPRYPNGQPPPISGPSEENFKEHTTHVPIKGMARGVGTAYERLLR